MKSLKSFLILCTFAVTMGTVWKGNFCLAHKTAFDGILFYVFAAALLLCAIGVILNRSRIPFAIGGILSSVCFFVQIFRFPVDTVSTYWISEHLIAYIVYHILRTCMQLLALCLYCYLLKRILKNEKTGELTIPVYSLSLAANAVLLFMNLYLFDPVLHYDFSDVLSVLFDFLPGCAALSCCTFYAVSQKKHARIDHVNQYLGAFWQRTLWLRFYIFWRLPLIFLFGSVGLLGNILRFVNSKEAISDIFIFSSAVTFLLLLLYVYTYITMRRFSSAGYIANIVLLVAETVSIFFSGAVFSSSQFLGSLIGGTLLWFLPNLFYFRKREEIFTANASTLKNLPDDAAVDSSADLGSLSVWHCEICGAENPDSSNACQTCGTKKPLKS